MMDIEIIVMGFISAIVGALFTFIVFSHDYQKGQTDCIQGKIKYELVVQPNGETKWEEKK